MVRARRSARSCARVRVHASVRDRTRRGWACARTGFPAAGARTMKGLLGETAVDLTGVAPVLAAPSPEASESFTTGLRCLLAKVRLQRRTMCALTFDVGLGCLGCPRTCECRADPWYLARSGVLHRRRSAMVRARRSARGRGRGRAHGSVRDRACRGVAVRVRAVPRLAGGRRTSFSARLGLIRRALFWYSQRHLVVRRKASQPDCIYYLHGCDPGAYGCAWVQTHA